MADEIDRQEVQVNELLFLRRNNARLREQRDAAESQADQYGALADELAQQLAAYQAREEQNDNKENA